MTVAELITELQRYDSTWRVVTPGFDEAGLADVVIECPAVVEFGEYTSDARYVGPHLWLHEPEDIGDRKSNALVINFSEEEP